MHFTCSVERKPTSFSLQTASDRFYPDFLVGLENGGIVAAEYRGGHLAGSDESREKTAYWRTLGTVRQQLRIRVGRTARLEPVERCRGPRFRTGSQLG
ncbi:MAG TPA: hypothetical protein VM619_06930 [Luteimonas sp.]|nr:hypothetical protein [Luteimonas sp.]